MISSPPNPKKHYDSHFDPSNSQTITRTKTNLTLSLKFGD
jgi:hypothetical protein